MLQLVKNLFGVKAPRQQSCTLEITDRCLCLAEIEPSGFFNLSFLFIGNYGNYLIGAPRNFETFDRVFYNRGGVKYGFPLSLDPEESRSFEALFRRYGLYLVTDRTELSWQMPTLLPGMAAINDLKFELFSFAGLPGIKCHSQGKSLIFHDLIVAEGQTLRYAHSEDRNDTSCLGSFHSQGHILMPKRFRGSAIDLAGCLTGACKVEQLALDSIKNDQGFKHLTASKAEARNALSIDDVVERLKGERFIFNHDTVTNTIAFYDDIEFERNDFEILSPISRMQLQAVLVEAGYKRCAGGIYTHTHSTSAPEFFLLPPPRSLMSGLLDMFNARGTRQTVILTPTQQAALIAGSEREDRDERLLTLAGNLPINQRKLSDFLKSSHISWPETFKAEFMTRQKQVTSKYRRLKPKGAKRKA